MTKGLGFLRGRVRRFSGEMLVPQVGWNEVRHRREHSLMNEIEDHEYFYFVHSYYCDAADESAVLGETEYGGWYASIVARANICGVQFHPEKSQTAGLKLLQNFAQANLS